MKKLIFIAGVILISCVVLDYKNKDVLFLSVFAVILIKYWHDHSKPKNPSAHKGWKLLLKLEEKIGSREDDDAYIYSLLKRYTLRNLCHLKCGIRQRISEWKMSGMMPMSLRDEEFTDKRINYYTRLRRMTENCLREKESRSIFHH